MDVNNRNNTNSEVTDYIESHLDSDIENLINGGEIDLGDTEVPEFEEDEIYGAIMSEVSRKPDLLSLAAKWFSAAVLVLAVAASAFYFMKGETIPDSKMIYADRGEKVIVILSDGTKVSLNAESKLYYPSQFVGDTRQVKIVGEAYFDVTSNKENPFIVNTGDMIIKVTGTKFNVNAYPEAGHIITTLDEGCISIGKNADNLTMMYPGQCADYERATSNCTIVDSDVSGEASEWMKNQFVFRNTPINEVLLAAERKFDVNFTVANPEIEEYTYNFSCGASDMSDIISIMETVTPVRFVKAGKDSFIVK